MEALPNSWAGKIKAALAKSVGGIIEAGQLLIEAKTDLGHGGFLQMVKDDLGWSPRQAERYMQVARHPRLSNATNSSHLPPAIDTLLVLSHLSDQAFDLALQTGDINSGMSRKDADALVEGKQLRLPGESKSYLSASGHELRLVVEMDALMPDTLKLETASQALIDEIQAAMRGLSKSAARIGDSGEVERFQALFAKMEKRVAECAEEYWQLRKSEIESFQEKFARTEKCVADLTKEYGRLRRTVNQLMDDEDALSHVLDD